MNAQGPYLGTVKAFSVASGPASSITYTTVINKGDGTTQLTGVKPGTNRPPDSVDTRAARVGTCYTVWWTPAGYVHLIQEWPDFAACPGAAT